MVWECFGGDAVGDFVKVEGIVDFKHYHNIFGIDFLGCGFTLQQGNDQNTPPDFVKSSHPRVPIAIQMNSLEINWINYLWEYCKKNPF